MFCVLRAALGTIVPPALWTIPRSGAAREPERFAVAAATPYIQGAGRKAGYGDKRRS